MGKVMKKRLQPAAEPLVAGPLRELDDQLCGLIRNVELGAVADPVEDHPVGVRHPLGPKS